MDVLLELFISTYKIEQQTLTTYIQAYTLYLQYLVIYLVVIYKSSRTPSTGRPTCYGQSEAKSITMESPDDKRECCKPFYSQPDHETHW